MRLSSCFGDSCPFRAEEDAPAEEPEEEAEAPPVEETK